MSGMSKTITRALGRSFEQDLRREVSSVPVGSRIPSIRELRARYSVGQAAVERAVARLSQQGLIEVRPKSGIYRSVTPAGPITVIYRSRQEVIDTAGGYYAEFVMHLIAEMAKTGHVVRLLSTEDDQEFSTIVRRVNRNNERAITFALKWSDVETINGQAGSASNFIHVLPNFVEPIGNSVILDDREIIRLQMEHLMERGHRSIAFLHGYDESKWSRAAFRRYNAFHDFILNHRAELPDATLRAAGINGFETYDALIDLHRHGPPPTAILIAADVCVRDAYRALREVGREPGRDVAVASVNNRPWCDYVEPGLTSIDISPRRGAEAVTQLLGKLEVGEPVESQILEARLIVRASSDFDVSAA